MIYEELRSGVVGRICVEKGKVEEGGMCRARYSPGPEGAIVMGVGESARSANRHCSSAKSV